MSTTMMVCLGILSLCTLAIGVSTVIVHVQDIKLKRIEEKNKKIHLLDFGPPSADETPNLSERLDEEYEDIYNRDEEDEDEEEYPPIGSGDLFS